MQRQHHRSLPADWCDLSWRDAIFTLHKQRGSPAHSRPTTAHTRLRSGRLPARRVVRVSGSPDAGGAGCTEKSASAPTEGGSAKCRIWWMTSAQTLKSVFFFNRLIHNNKSHTTFSVLFLYVYLSCSPETCARELRFYTIKPNKAKMPQNIQSKNKPRLIVWLMMHPVCVLYEKEKRNTANPLFKLNICLKIFIMTCRLQHQHRLRRDFWSSDENKHCYPLALEHYGSLGLNSRKRSHNPFTWSFLKSYTTPRRVKDLM